MPGSRLPLGLGTFTSVCMVLVCELTSAEKRATLPNDCFTQRSYFDLDRLADFDVFHVGFRHRNHQPVDIFLGQPHQRR